VQVLEVDTAVLIPCTATQASPHRPSPTESAVVGSTEVAITCAQLVSPECFVAKGIEPEDLLPCAIMAASRVVTSACSERPAQAVVSTAAAATAQRIISLGWPPDGNVWSNQGEAGSTSRAARALDTIGKDMGFTYDQTKR
jgi:hypothetical protein